MKVLISVGFYDIGCDIGILWLDGCKAGDFTEFLVVLVEWFDF